MHEYPIDNLWQKGCYLARINGPDDRYIVEREFLRGKPVKSRGVVEYGPKDLGRLPAWILRAGRECSGCGRPNPSHVELLAARPEGWETVAVGVSSGDLLALWEQGPPDHDPAEQVRTVLNPERVPVYAADLDAPF